MNLFKVTDHGLAVFYANFVHQIPPLNKAKMREMKEYMDNLAKPVKGLGRLEELAAHLAGMATVVKGAVNIYPANG